MMAESSRWCSLEQTGVAHVTKRWILNDEFKRENNTTAKNKTKQKKNIKGNRVESRRPLGKHETSERMGSKHCHIRKSGRRMMGAPFVHVFMMDVCAGDGLSGKVLDQTPLSEPRGTRGTDRPTPPFTLV